MAVWLCPGQGAQKAGMGADFFAQGSARFARLADVFATAGRITGVDAAVLACEGTDEQVNDPFNAQVLTAALSIGIGFELMERGFEPQALVGFSLGQISALALSGMLGVEDTFALLKERAAGMASACEEHPGAMCALLKASHEEAAELCQKQSQVQILVPANYNAPGQVVVSGEFEAVERAEQAWGALPGKRAKRLNVAGGFHSPLMAAAADRTGKAAQALEFKEPRIPVLCNTDAKPLTTASVAQRLELQVKSPVMFEQSIAALLEQGADEFVEVGFGDVLTGLVKRQDRGVTRACTGTVEEFDAYTAVKEAC